MEDIIPKQVSFSLREMHKLKILKRSVATKLIHQGSLESFKVGNKWFVLRTEIINFINKQTVNKGVNSD